MGTVEIFQELLRVREEELRDKIYGMGIKDRDGIKGLMGLPKYSSLLEVFENVIRIRKILGR